MKTNLTTEQQNIINSLVLEFTKKNTTQTNGLDVNSIINDLKYQRDERIKKEIEDKNIENMKAKIIKDMFWNDTKDFVKLFESMGCVVSYQSQSIGIWFNYNSICTMKFYYNFNDVNYAFCFHYGGHTYGGDRNQTISDFLVSKSFNVILTKIYNYIEDNK